MNYELDVMVTNEYKDGPPVHADLAKVVQGGEPVQHLVKQSVEGEHFATHRINH